MPIKPLSFKGDKKPSKKRKHPASTHESSALTTEATAASSEDDTWTYPSHPSDLSGPVLIVIPPSDTNTNTADPPPIHALTSDAHGAVFPTPLENILAADPFTAEPHDVRQVWIAARVAGSAELSFKSSTGGFLAAETGSGVVSARREARGREEGWLVELVAHDELADDDAAQAGEGRRLFRLRSAASAAGSAAKKDGDGDGEGEGAAQYLAATTSPTTNKTTLRADASAAATSTHLILRMQSRFKPSLVAHSTQKAGEKISRAALEAAVGRRLDDDEVRRLKRAKKEGTYHEEILDVRVKGKHDKFASS